MNRRLLHILSLILLPVLSFSREDKGHWKGVGIEGNFIAGRIIRHSVNFTGPIPDASYAFDLNIVKQTYGQKEWHQRRNYPQLGLGLFYINYNQPEIYGQVLGIYPNITIPLLRFKNFEWSLRAGMGVGYITKPYARFPKPNLENVAIGGHWNNVSPFSTTIRWKVNQHWDLQGGFSFTHVSNAYFQTPNLGINMWGFQLGARYFPTTSTPEKRIRDIKPLRNRWLVQAKAGLAFVQYRPADGPMYPVYSGSVFASKRYLSKNKVFAGLDFYYHTGTYSFIKSIENFKGEEGKHSYQLAVFAGNEFLLGRVGVVLQAGYYLKTMYNQSDRIYEKLGGNFYLIQNEKGIVKELFFSAMLKAHMASAELFEMGVGIGI